MNKAVAHYDRRGEFIWINYMRGDSVKTQLTIEMINPDEILESDFNFHPLMYAVSRKTGHGLDIEIMFESVEEVGEIIRVYYYFPNGKSEYCFRILDKKQVDYEGFPYFGKSKIR